LSENLLHGFFSEGSGFDSERKGSGSKMTNAYYIAGAVETYGESVVADLIEKIGDDNEIMALIDIEAGLKLLKIARFKTEDGVSFVKKE
jgi:hypothetical protein